MTTCKMKFTPLGARAFFVDGVEVDERAYRKGVDREQGEMRKVLVKQNGRRFRVPGCFGDSTEWRFENGGKGRYCPQLGKKHQRQAYYSSKRELIEKAKHRGYVVDQAN